MEFGVLGPISAWADGETISVGGPRQQCVLGALLVDLGKEVPVDRLIDYLWDDAPPRTARSVIHVQISHLRRTFPDLIQTTAGGYLAQLDSGRVDLHRFRELAARAKEAGDPREGVLFWERAFSCWRGKPFSGTGSNHLWYTVCQPLLEEGWAAEVAWAECAFSLRRYQEIVTRLTPLVREEPLRERLQYLLIAALHRSGQRATALRVFHETREHLAEELGVDPSPEVMELHQRILREPDNAARPQAESPAGAPVRGAERGAPTEEWPAELVPRNDLPRDIPDFTGRERSLREVLQAGQDAGDRAEVSVITGPGGAGKTTLAVHAAHRLMERFPDGQLFIDLYAYAVDQEPLTAASALGSLLRAVGVEPEAIPDSVEERSALWRAMLGGKRVLVVLDNALNFAQVNPLLPAAPGSLAVVTARHDLPGVSGARYVSLGMFGQRSSLRLFSTVLGAERVAREQEDASQVVRLCGGLPLALRIVIGRMLNRPNWTFGHVVQRLGEHQRRFRELRVDGQNVEAVFELSYQSLNDVQRRTFLLIGVMIGGTIDLHGAAALLDRELSEADDLLQELVSVCLLDEAGADLYRFHDLIGAYARQKALEGMPESDTECARGRLADHYLDMAHRAADWLGPRAHHYEVGASEASRYRNELSSRHEAVAWFERHQENLASTVDFYASRGAGEQAWQLADSLWQSYVSHGRSELLLSTQEKALAASRTQGNERGSAVTLIGLGIAHCLAGRFEVSLELLDQAHGILKGLGDREGETRAHGNLGMVYERMGRFQDALSCLEKVLDYALEVGDRRLEVLQRANIALQCQMLGDFPRAVEMCETALEIRTENGLSHGHAAALRILGEIDTGSGDFERAFQRFAEALELAQSLGSPTDEIYTRNALAVAQRESGKPEAAIGSHLQALQSAEDSAQRSGDAEILNELGVSYMRAQRYEDAKVSYEQALRIARERKERYIEARALLGLGLLPPEVVAPRTAIDGLSTADGLFTELGVPEVEQVRAELGRRYDAA